MKLCVGPHVLIITTAQSGRVYVKCRLCSFAEIQFPRIPGLVDDTCMVHQGPIIACEHLHRVGGRRKEKVPF